MWFCLGFSFDGGSESAVSFYKLVKFLPGGGVLPGGTFWFRPGLVLIQVSGGF